ncbi:MAG: hypothetical protein JXJ04_10850 [Spirochaetales bacterium]|nr:hypothetical protein [Spirochaetales bacterium]
MKRIWIILLMVFIVGTLFCETDDPLSFLTFDCCLAGARNSLEDRVTGSMALGFDFFHSSSLMYSASAAFDFFNPDQFVLSYEGSLGFAFAGESGRHKVFGAFFGMEEGVDKDSITYTTIEGMSTYTSLHLFEIGARGRMSWFTEFGYNEWYDRTKSTEETSELFLVAGYRFVSVSNTILPPFQDFDISIKGVVGMYSIDDAYYEAGDLISSHFGPDELKYGFLVGLRYYLVSSEIGLIGDKLCWSVYFDLPLTFIFK